MRRLFFGLILSLLLSNQTNAQQFREFLGPADYAQPNRTSPRYRITYNARGFDQPKTKKIRKTGKWLEKQGAGHIAPEFRDFATLMTELESQIPEWVDSAWDAVKAKWVGCGGTYARVAQSFKPSSLTVLVEPGPFWVSQHGVYAAGLTDGRTIRAVNVNASYVLTDPSRAWLRRFDLLVEWEMGNSLAMAAGIKFSGLDHEIGNKAPCTR